METWILIFFTAATNLTPANMYQFAERQTYDSLIECEQSAESQLADKVASYLCIKGKDT